MERTGLQRWTLIVVVLVALWSCPVVRADCVTSVDLDGSVVKAGEREDGECKSGSLMVVGGCMQHGYVSNIDIDMVSSGEGAVILSVIYGSGKFAYAFAELDDTSGFVRFHFDPPFYNDVGQAYPIDYPPAPFNTVYNPLIMSLEPYNGELQFAVIADVEKPTDTLLSYVQRLEGCNLIYEPTGELKSKAYNMNIMFHMKSPPKLVKASYLWLIKNLKVTTKSVITFTVELDSPDDLSKEAIEVTNGKVSALRVVVGSPDRLIEKRDLGSVFEVDVSGSCDGLVRLCVYGVCDEVSYIGCLSRAFTNTC